MKFIILLTFLFHSLPSFATVTSEDSIKFSADINAKNCVKDSDIISDKYSSLFKKLNTYIDTRRNVIGYSSSIPDEWYQEVLKVTASEKFIHFGLGTYSVLKGAIFADLSLKSGLVIFGSATAGTITAGVIAAMSVAAGANLISYTAFRNIQESNNKKIRANYSDFYSMAKEVAHLDKETLKAHFLKNTEKGQIESSLDDYFSLFEELRARLNDITGDYLKRPKFFNMEHTQVGLLHEKYLDQLLKSEISGAITIYNTLAIGCSLESLNYSIDDL